MLGLCKPISVVKKEVKQTIKQWNNYATPQILHEWIIFIDGKLHLDYYVDGLSGTKCTLNCFDLLG